MLKISKNKMAATAVQWAMRYENSVKISRLWVSYYNGNNDRAARVLFVQHPREQGEWLRQNPRYARVLTASFALLPRVLDEQHPRSLVIIPWIQAHLSTHSTEKACPTNSETRDLGC